MKKILRTRLILIMMVFVASFMAAMPQAARFSDLKIIRDVEIETTLKGWVEPLAQAAKINPDQIKLVLVQSDQINAFVAGGANIFIFTGLIDKAETPGEIIGVLAHEIGHISGGHLIHSGQAMRRASYESILGTALGIGAALLTGDGRAAAAVSMGAQHLAMTNYLSHSRTNESSADQAALRFLETAEINPSGFLSFFKKLEDQELLPAHKQNEYVRTHPLTRNRIETITRQVEASAHAGKAMPSAWDEQLARMQAKLIGFGKPDYVAWSYGDRDQSFAARYARAIAAYRKSTVDEALARIDALIAEEPKNAYLYELKAQMLMEFSRVEEAMPSLRKAQAMMPHESYFKMTLAHGQMEYAAYQPKAQEAELLRRAIDNLHQARQDEPRSTRIHRLLATAYGRLGQQDHARYHLAEEAVLKSDLAYAHKLLSRLLDTLPKDSKLAFKAKDLLDFVVMSEKSRKR